MSHALLKVGKAFVVPLQFDGIRSLDDRYVAELFYRRRTHVTASELRDVRAALGWTQGQIAEYLDVHRRTVIRGERRGMECARGTLVRQRWCELYLRVNPYHPWPSRRLNPRATDLRYAPVAGRRDRPTWG